MDRDPIDRHIGHRIFLARIAMCWPRSTLAKRLGVGEPEIARYESGEERIGASQLYALAQIFDVSAQYFFDGMSLEGGGPGQRSLGAVRSASKEMVDQWLLGVVTACDEIDNHAVRKALGDLVNVLRRSSAVGYSGNRFRSRD